MDKAFQAVKDRPRARTAGPARAIATTLSRIGWSIISADTWMTDDNLVLDLSVYSAAYVAKVAIASIWRWISKRIAKYLAAPYLARGKWWDPIRKLQRSNLG